MLSGVELQCIGHFRLIFALLCLDNYHIVQKGALDVIFSVTKSQECVQDIANSDVLGCLLLLFFSLSDPDSQSLVLDTLYGLTSLTKMVKEAVTKGWTKSFIYLDFLFFMLFLLTRTVFSGALIYALDIFCNSSVSSLREKSAELIARMAADKLVGPKVRLIVCRFLPAVFADAMRESPNTCVHMFEGNHENPELIWDSSCRDRVSSLVSSLKNK